MVTLQQLRKKIERIDTKIIFLVAERQKLAPQFCLVKAKMNLSLHQKGREKELLRKYCEIAQGKKISNGLIEKIFPILFQASLKEQRRCLKKKD
jgi:chorismate mutase